MTATEWIVIVGGAVLGYGLVSMFMRRAPRSDAGPATPPWHEVLDVSASASVDEIRAAHAAAAARYRGEDLAAMGAEFETLAAQRLQALDAALAAGLAARETGA